MTGVSLVSQRVASGTLAKRVPAAAPSGDTTSPGRECVAVRPTHPEANASSGRESAAVGARRCATLFCPSQATVVLRMSHPSDRSDPWLDEVCADCAQGYLRRPMFQAEVVG